jgi:pyridoxamine 5'-phosphate oxidase
MAWIAEARAGGVALPEAVTLATVDADGAPDARVVLLKQRSGLNLNFFTNYKSSKASQLQREARACLVLHHHQAERQMRVRGTCQKISSAESDAYFFSRPRESQIGAWASEQSEALESSKALADRVEEFRKRFAGQDVPRPPHWGGIALRASTVEIWLGQSGRLHDRAIFRLQAGSEQSPIWRHQLLNP